MSFPLPRRRLKVRPQPKPFAYRRAGRVKGTSRKEQKNTKHFTTQGITLQMLDKEIAILASMGRRNPKLRRPGAAIRYLMRIGDAYYAVNPLALVPDNIFSPRYHASRRGQYTNKVRPTFTLDELKIINRISRRVARACGIDPDEVKPLYGCRALMAYGMHAAQQRGLL